MSRKRKSKSKPLIKAPETSLEDNQGVSQFKGSSYNGKGNVDHGKVISNRKRR